MLRRDVELNSFKLHRVHQRASWQGEALYERHGKDIKDGGKLSGAGFLD